MNEKLSLTALRDLVAPFATPNDRRGLWETGLTLFLFFAFLGLAGFASTHSTLAAIAISGISGFLLTRLFVLHHDCGHRSLFATQWLNLWVGRLLALFALTPFDYWRRIHHRHHQNTGRLDAVRGDGEVWIYTVAEYAQLSFFRKLQYRLYHFPPILFCIGPIYLFILHYRLWWKATDTRDQRSMILYNIALALVIAVALMVVEPATLAVVYLPAVVVGAMTGVWLFYIQHVFEQAYFAHDGGAHPYDRRAAFVAGSSYYKLPWLLDWVTAGIGYHSLHHLNPRIPSYRLRDCWNATSHAFGDTPTFTLRKSFSMIGFALWDEQSEKMVRFA